MNGMFKLNVTEDKRKEEISVAIDFIVSLCNKYGIRLIAKEIKGKNIVVIQDTLNNDKEYIIIKNN